MYWEIAQFTLIFFSDAKKIPLDEVTIVLFLPQDFFLATRTFFLLQEKKSSAKKRNLVPMRKSWDKKKLFCHFIKRNFLRIRKNFCECWIEYEWSD